MRMSLVIASRERSGQLQRSLARLNLEAMGRLAVDLILVDSASADDTHEVMLAFARGSGASVKVIRAERPGAAIARNIGAAAADGEALIFTDDDCYLDHAYFDVIAALFRPDRFQYGGGHTALFDPSDAPSAVTDMSRLDRVSTIEPGTLLISGLIQGANMFFARAAFERLGGFDEALGAGTPFGCEDIDLCTRASLAGYTGVLLPDAKVFHHHGRKSGGAALAAAERGYDRGRGAYYARLIAAGHRNALELWAKGPHFRASGPMTRTELTILRHELRGAADYLDIVLGELDAGNPAADAASDVPPASDGQ